MQSPPALIRQTNPPYTYLTGLNKYQKGDFISSIVAFYQKSTFNLLNPFTTISGYLNLWDIFRFIFRQLRMTFFRKIMVAEKNNFFFWGGGGGFYGHFNSFTNYREFNIFCYPLSMLTFFDLSLSL